MHECLLKPRVMGLSQVAEAPELAALGLAALASVVRECQQQQGTRRTRQTCCHRAIAAHELTQRMTCGPEPSLTHARLRLPVLHGRNSY